MPAIEFARGLESFEYNGQNGAPRAHNWTWFIAFSCGTPTHWTLCGMILGSIWCGLIPTILTEEMITVWWYKEWSSIILLLVHWWLCCNANVIVFCMIVGTWCCMIYLRDWWTSTWSTWWRLLEGWDYVCEVSRGRQHDEVYLVVVVASSLHASNEVIRHRHQLESVWSFCYLKTENWKYLNTSRKFQFQLLKTYISVLLIDILVWVT